MKLAYKISIPIAIVILSLILLVTYTSNSAQKKIIENGQNLTKTIIFEQLETNKKEALATRKLEVELFLDDAIKIAAEYLEPKKDMWLPEEFINSNDPLALMIQNEQKDITQEERDEFKEEMNSSLKKLTKYKIIQSVFIKSHVKDKEDLFIGVKKDKTYTTLTKNVFSKNDPNKKLGFVELQYSDKFIQEQFDQARDLIVQDLTIKNKEQNKDIDAILEQQTIFNLVITCILLIIILRLISTLVLKPLNHVKNGLDSFFSFLQNKQKEIEPISLKSSDEFGQIATSLNENIQVASELHTQIHDLNTNLEKKVEQRTLQLHERSTKVTQLLDISSDGFLSFDHTLKVDSEYSKECESIFNQPIDGLNIADLLFKNTNEEKDVFIKLLNDIFNPKTPNKRKKVFLRLIKNQFILDDKYITAQYQYVEEEKIILILTNITDKVALEKKLNEEKQTLKMIVSAVKDLEEFKELINEYYNFCDNIQLYLKDKTNFKENLLLFYRKIHTFKGNFAQKELLHVVQKLHTFENSLNNLIKNSSTTYNDFVTIIETNNLKEWLALDIKIIENVLDEDLLDQEGILKIAYSLIDNLESKINTLLHYNKDERDVTYEDLLNDVLQMKNRSIVDYLSPYLLLTKQLSTKLQKPLYPIEITSSTPIYVNNDIKPFMKSLVHIFRNSMDHGIESTEERTLLKKDTTATIQCKIDIDKSNLLLTITDDGKGIDQEIIKKKALEKGIVSEQELKDMKKDEILLIIFQDSFSTEEKVSELSGRGIGLGAVKFECEKLGGSIEIDSVLNKGTTFKFTIPIKNIQ